MSPEPMSPRENPSRQRLRRWGSRLAQGLTAPFVAVFFVIELLRWRFGRRSADPEVPGALRLRAASESQTGTNRSIAALPAGRPEVPGQRPAATRVPARAQRVGGRRGVRRAAGAQELGLAAEAALHGNLLRCLTPAAVAVVVEGAAEGGGLTPSGLSAVLERLVELGARAEDCRQVLDRAGFQLRRTDPVRERIIRLQWSSDAGQYVWQHRAVACLWFTAGGRWKASGAHLAPCNRVRILLDPQGRALSWTLA